VAVVAAVFDEFLGSGEVCRSGVIRDKIASQVLAFLPRILLLAEKEAGTVKVDVDSVPNG